MNRKSTYFLTIIDTLDYILIFFFEMASKYEIDPELFRCIGLDNDLAKLLTLLIEFFDYKSGFEPFSD